jgi:hypothetical protein
VIAAADFLARRAWRAVLAVALSVCPLQPLASQPSPTAIVDRLRADAGRPIDFHAAVFPESVYVGQQVTYQVAVLLSESARSRLRRNPEFLPPELRGLLAYELGTPRRVAPRSYGGGVFEAHVFQRALFAVKPGVVTVPAPQLTYRLPQSASYFSREEQYTVSAESAQLVVRPLPDEGRPAEFTGAVGVLKASTRMDVATARVGDPLVLTVRLEGSGNVKLLPRPAVELSWASVVAGTERVQIDTSGPLVRGVKEFDYILTPAQSGAAVLPVVRYSYFDPYRRAYAWAETVPADVIVADGALATAPAGEEAAVLPLRAWRQTSAPRLAEWPAATRVTLIVIWVLAPWPALFMLVRRMQRRRRPARAQAPTAVRIDVDTDRSPRGTARDVRRILLAQLATRLRVAPADLVARRDVERILRRRGVTRATTRDLLALLDDLAVRGFSAMESATDGAPERLASHSEQLLARVNVEAVQRDRTALWSRRARRAGTLVLVLLSAGVAGVLRAQQAAAVPNLEQEARAAYDGRRYVSAADRYAEAVLGRPNDVDLLVNWGTAAWAAADTVSAVVAWQRAARLEPLAVDIQERVALLPAGARGGDATVPLVPVQLLAIAATICWVAAWVVLLWAWRATSARDAGRRDFMTVMGVVLLLLAGSAAGTAWWGEKTLDVRGLAVARRPESMRARPASDANTVGGVATGDIVRIEREQEGWDRVRHADGRQGWIPAARLMPLLPASTNR